MTEADSGVGPRADTPLAELDPELTVLVEEIGNDASYRTIHDPDYRDVPADDPSAFTEIPLEDARDISDDFCCDCFTRAMVDAEITSTSS